MERDKIVNHTGTGTMKLVTNLPIESYNTGLITRKKSTDNDENNFFFS